MANLKALQKENDRLKKIGAELELDKLILKRAWILKAQSLMTEDLRQAVAYTRQRLATSERRTCRARGRQQYKAASKDEEALRLAVILLAKRCGRYGYR